MPNELSTPEMVAARLKSQGYIVTKFCNYESFTSCVDAIGNSFACRRIEVDTKSRAKLATATSMPLHTDHPAANVVAWFCKENSDSGGVSVLQDFDSVRNSLSRQHLADLARIQVKVPKSSTSLPMCSMDGLYFADWLLSAPSRIRYCDAINEFERQLREHDLIKIRLKKNEALFIDNKRILHGRSEIQNTTKKRLLLRHWISTSGYSAAA